MVHLKEKLLSSFLAFENEKDVDSYVHDIRTQAIKKFEEEGIELDPRLKRRRR